MCCTGDKCYTSIDWALQGPQKQRALSGKFCNWIDLIALIRSQINLDISAGETSPSQVTMELVSTLIDQLDEEKFVYKTNFSDPPVDVDAADATGFGLICEINCKLLNVLVKKCSETVDGVPVATLDSVKTLNYTNSVAVNAHLHFLCCVSDHFRELQVFLERFVKAKGCESPC